MLVPLYGFVEGDTIGVLVLAHHDMTMKEVAGKLRDSARVRVGVSSVDWELRVDDEPVEEELLVGDLGLEPLTRIDLRRRGP